MDNVACVVMYCNMVPCVMCETLGRIDSVLCGGWYAGCGRGRRGKMEGRWGVRGVG